jgi:LysM repeat protein
VQEIGDFMLEAKRPLRVFLCHAHSDKDDVKVLYERLVQDGVDAWLDKERLLPGQDWEFEIRKAVKASDVIVVCLSKQFNNAGFRQKEVRLALDTAMEKPDGEIFIITARLEACENLESLSKWHRVDLFDDHGYDILLKALRARADSIGATLRIKRSSRPRISSPPLKVEEPIEEDQPTVSSPDKAPAQKANLDSRNESSGIPPTATGKPFKLKTEYMVAIIGAAATILAAIINSPLVESWFTQTPAPTATVSTQISASQAVSFATNPPTETRSPAQANPSPGLTLQPGTTIQHMVLAGESLFQIARCYGADFENPQNTNPQISDPRILSTGTKIIVPNIGSNGEIYGPPCVAYYTVQYHDTWESIADKFNADVAVLQAANSRGTFTIGSLIVIPSNSAATPLIRISVSSPLFETAGEVFPNLQNCYKLNILPDQELHFTTTTATDRVPQTVHGPNESVNEQTISLILLGSLVPESGYYEYCIFNKSASTIAYSLEVRLFQ